MSDNIKYIIYVFNLRTYICTTLTYTKFHYNQRIKICLFKHRIQLKIGIGIVKIVYC